MVYLAWRRTIRHCIGMPKNCGRYYNRFITSGNGPQRYLVYFFERCSHPVPQAMLPHGEPWRATASNGARIYLRRQEGRHTRITSSLMLSMFPMPAASCSVAWRRRRLYHTNTVKARTRCHPARAPSPTCLGEIQHLVRGGHSDACEL